MNECILTELVVNDGSHVVQQHELHELELEWVLDTLDLVDDVDVDSIMVQLGPIFSAFSKDDHQ